jgi:hypothetical protein
MAKPLNTGEIEKVKVMLANNSSIQEIARTLKRSPSTIHKMAHEPDTIKAVQALRAEIAGQFEDLAKRALTEVTDKKLKKTSAYQNTLIAGIAAQRSSELRGLDRSEHMTPKIIINIGDLKSWGKSVEGPAQECTYEEVKGKLDD